MNSLKTVIVMTVMAVVAYGVYATLTKGPIAEVSDLAEDGPAVDVPSGTELGEPEPEPRYLPAGPEESAPPAETMADRDHPHDHDHESTDSAPPADPFGRDRAADDAADDGADSGYAVAGDDPYRNSADAAAVEDAAATSSDAPADPAAGTDDDYTRYDDYARRRDPAANDAARTASAGPADPEQPAQGAAGDRSQFEAEMRDVQAQLDANHLADALRGLTRWYGSGQLSTEEQAELYDLLDQLAGTVVYSQEHWLLAPHKVREGETLATIAAEYDVPWQLLAKVNGLSDPAALTPGAELKVVQGPFEAEVDLSKYRLTLFVDGCYAGRFLIGVGDEPVPEGNFNVENKQIDPQYETPDRRIVMADDPDNPLGKYWIGLGENFGIHGAADERSIGQTAGRGWIRLTQRDIEDVYDILSEDSPVRIVR